MQRFVGAEQLFAALFPLPPGCRQCRFGELRRWLLLAVLAVLAVAKRHRLGCPRNCHVAELAQLVVDAAPPLHCGDEDVVEAQSTG